MNDSRLLTDIQNQERSLIKVLAAQIGGGRAALTEAARMLRSAQRIVITGIGASLHSAIPLYYELAGRGMNCSIIESAELLHYQTRVCEGAAVVLVSRSGESIEIVKLLERLKVTAESVIAICNEPASTLAKQASVAVIVGSLPDEIVAVQSYTGTVAAALLLAGEVVGEFEKVRAEIADCLPQISVLIAAQLEMVGGWDDFYRVGSPIYFLGRGPSYASALEGALLVGETAKEPAVGLAAGNFRHGPVEIVDGNFRAVVFAQRGATRALNIALAKQLVGFGARVRVIGQAGEDATGLSVIASPEVAERIAPLVDIVPVQLAALRLAFVKGLEIGKFRHTGQVTRDEVAF
jgi:glucosamine--fructose-6-phosphate aminotransferase (isomerizing)